MHLPIADIKNKLSAYFQSARKTGSVLILDIGSYNIKLAEAEKQEQGFVIKHLSVNLVPHELSQTESVNTPHYIDFLKRLLSEQKISSLRAIICVSHHQLEVKNLIVPAMTQKELKASISWEAKDIFTIHLDNAVVDYTVLREMDTNEGKKLELCVAAVPKTVIEDYSLLLNALRLSPVAFFLEPQTAWNVIKDIPNFKAKNTIVLINMGAEKTIASIFENGRLELMRNLTTASNKFTANIASKVKTINDEDLGLIKAELIKTKYGISVIEGQIEENVTSQSIFAALRPALEDLVFELNHLLEYYKSEHGGSAVEYAVFYGGGSKMPGLSDYISKSLGMPVLSVDLVKNEKIKYLDSQKEVIEKDSVFLVNIAGVFLSGDNLISLLPQENKDQLEIKLQTGRWVKVWACLIAGLLALYIPIGIMHWIKKKTLAKLETKYMGLLSVEEDLKRYNLIVSELNSKMSLCNKISKAQSFWEDVLKELALLVPNSVVLNEVSYNTPSGQQDGSKLVFVISGVVHMKGVRPEEEITRFLQNLEKSQYFFNIELEFSKEAKTGDEKVIEFKIGCKIK